MMEEYDSVEMVERVIGHPVLDLTNRAGYSAPGNTFKPLQLITSGQLHIGDKMKSSHLKAQGIGTSESYEVRISWRHLQLLDQENCITSLGEQLAHASGERKRALLEMLIRERYSRILDCLSTLSHITPQALKDAFQQSDYEPASMRSKMITLFRGLCSEAGLIVGGIISFNRSDECITEIYPLTHQEMVVSREENVHMEDFSSNKSTNDAFPLEEKDQSEEPGQFFSRLLQFPKNPGWTDEDELWWEQAISINAKKFLQACKKGRKK